MCHLIHPFLKKTSPGNWVWQVLRTLRKLVDSRGAVLRTAFSGLHLLPTSPDLTQTVRSWELTQERKEQFSIQVRHPSRGTRLSMTHSGRGRREYEVDSFLPIKFSRWETIVLFA